MSISSVVTADLSLVSMTIKVVVEVYPIKLRQTYGRTQGDCGIGRQIHPALFTFPKNSNSAFIFYSSNYGERRRR